MSSFFLLRLDYVCNLTSKTKSFKMWMLQRWLPVINCPRQLETNTSSAGQREGTTLSPSLFMQIYSTIYTICVNTPQVLLLQALSLNILHLPSAFISTILNAEKYSALPSGNRQKHSAYSRLQSKSVRYLQNNSFQHLSQLYLFSSTIQS